MLVTSRLPVRKQSTAPTTQEWDHLIAPNPGEGEQVILRRRADEPLPASIDAFRQQVAALDYHPVDPFVASVSASIGASQNEVPKGEEKVAVSCPDYYGEGVEVLLGFHNGPNVPILLIFPGISGSGEGTGHTGLFKRLALERGWNYAVVPNSMSPEMLEDMPIDHPGNPRVDALSSRALLGALKDQYPEYFAHVSVAGYSYGAMLGANLVRLDEENQDRFIDGSLVAVSPPENLEHSMHQLDGLRQRYQENGGTIDDTGLRYKHDVKKYGYENFMESGLAAHGEGTNLDEIEISDKYGSRDSLQDEIEIIDKQFDHLLPMNTQAYQDANLLGKMKMRQQHGKIVDNITYEQLSSDWMSKDDWLHEQGMTPSQLTEKYSFSQAMEAIHKTPVLMMTSSDDYILNAGDVETMRKLEANPGPLEVVKVFDHGGHVGLDWNPKVAETLIDFAVGAKA